MSILKRIAAATSALVLATSLAACGGGDTTADPAAGGDTITIGIKFDQPGLGLKTGDTYEGFDVEVAKYVAKELGYDESKIVWKESPSAQRENLIQGNQVKLIFATYSITDARKEKISFGGPYFVAGQSLLVRTDSTITGKADLDGKKLCSVSGSTPAQKIKDELPGVQLQEFDTYSKCVEALANGSLDAVTTDDVILAGYAAQEAYKGKLKLAGEPFSEERYGVGLKKGDVDTCTKVNAAIAKMISSGEWKAALEKTVGPSGYTIPEPPTQDACS